MKALAAGALAAGLAVQAHGAISWTNGPPSSLTFGFDQGYTDTSVVPGTMPPWIVADFLTTGTNMVQLTIDNYLDPAGDDFLDRIYFNLNPELSNVPDDWEIMVQAVAGIGVSEASIDFGVTPPPGGGYSPFEVLLDFDDNAGSNRFTGGEQLVVNFKYTGTGDFDALDFKFSALNNDDDVDPIEIFAAAHIQSTGDDDEDSAWVHPSMVPEPGSSCALLLLLSSGMVFRSRRR